MACPGSGTPRPCRNANRRSATRSCGSFSSGSMTSGMWTLSGTLSHYARQVPAVQVARVAVSARPARLLPTLPLTCGRAIAFILPAWASDPRERPPSWRERWLTRVLLREEPGLVVADRSGGAGLPPPRLRPEARAGDRSSSSSSSSARSSASSGTSKAPSRAASLAYTTLLSLIPLLVAFTHILQELLRAALPRLPGADRHDPQRGHPVSVAADHLSPRALRRERRRPRRPSARSSSCSSPSGSSSPSKGR